MLVSEMQTELALHAHDPLGGELNAANWLSFIQSAARDARSSGWLVYNEDNESITIASNTYEYAVPSGFAYVTRILVSETISGTAVYVREVPRSHYEIRYNTIAAVAGPAITFTTITELTPNQTLKVVGQARPTIYTAAGNTIDPGMEGFLRERALYYGFRFLGAGLSELARWRQQMSIQCWQTSEAMLRRHPQEFRMHPSAMEVPSRG